MAKTRKRDEKFRLLLVRIPLDRAEQLEVAAHRIGLNSTAYIRMHTLIALDADQVVA